MCSAVLLLPADFYAGVALTPCRKKIYFYSHHLWLPTQPSNNSFLTSWPIGGFPSPPIGDRLCRYSMPAAAGCWVIPLQPVFGERVLLGIHQRVFECLVTVGCHWCVPALWMSNVKTGDKKWSLQQQGSTFKKHPHLQRYQCHFSHGLPVIVTSRRISLPPSLIAASLVSEMIVGFMSTALIFLPNLWTDLTFCIFAEIRLQVCERGQRTNIFTFLNFLFFWGEIMLCCRSAAAKPKQQQNKYPFPALCFYKIFYAPSLQDVKIHSFATDGGLQRAWLVSARWPCVGGHLRFTITEKLLVS